MPERLNTENPCSYCHHTRISHNTADLGFCKEPGCQCPRFVEAEDVAGGAIPPTLGAEYGEPQDTKFKDKPREKLGQ